MDKYDEKAREILLGKVRKTSQELADDIASELRKAGEREATLTKQLEGVKLSLQIITGEVETIPMSDPFVVAKEALASISTDKGEG